MFGLTIKSEFTASAARLLADHQSHHQVEVVAKLVEVI